MKDVIAEREKAPRSYRTWIALGALLLCGLGAVQVKATAVAQQAEAAARPQEQGEDEAAPRVKPLPPDTVLSQTAVREDLDAFQKDLEEEFAYLYTAKSDYRATINEIAAKSAHGMTVADLSVALAKVIGLFSDGHASVTPKHFPPGYLPFLLDLSGDRVIAYKPDRSGLVDAERPYLVSIDGKPLQTWMKTAEPYEPTGSDIYVRSHAVSFLSNVQFLRGLLGLAQTDTVRVELSEDGRKNLRSLEVPVLAKAPQKIEWPDTESRLLDGNIGYLRILKMDDAAVKTVDEWMPKFKDTRGLIIDVRGNGGGSRKALNELFPYVMNEQDDPRVESIAAFRLAEGRGPDFLAPRFEYTADSPVWSPRERKTVKEFAASWKPEWTPPRSEYSDWHYLVLDRRTNPSAYFYSKSIVILLDAHCFSATDIFLASFKGWRNVTMIGTPSGGGSAFAHFYTLPNSKLQARLASMVSFKHDGQRYDTHGTHPDIVVDRSPESLLESGKDNQLEAAAAFILSGKGYHAGDQATPQQSVKRDK